MKMDLIKNAKKKQPCIYAMKMSKHVYQDYIAYAKSKGVNLKYNRSSKRCISDQINYNHSIKIWPAKYMRKKYRKQLYVPCSIVIEYAPELKFPLRLKHEIGILDKKGNIKTL